MIYRARSAIIVEPNLGISDVLFDTLVSWGFSVLACSSHAAAAHAAGDLPRTDLLAACYPTVDDEIDGAYLSEAREKQNGHLPVILMLSDEFSTDEGAPAHAIRLSVHLATGIRDPCRSAANRNIDQTDRQ